MAVFGRCEVWGFSSTPRVGTLSNESEDSSLLIPFQLTHPPTAGLTMQ